MVADQLTRLRGFLEGAFPKRHTFVRAEGAEVRGVGNGCRNVVEIDHGHGLKPRFSHLATVYITVGQRVAIGTKLGGSGSTGRSLGPHLHDEVGVDGRLQNPERFLEAG
jgi:murein DD-endopeptidase MepM/ murein hydrolase activator NlpD